MKTVDYRAGMTLDERRAHARKMRRAFKGIMPRRRAAMLNADFRRLRTGDLRAAGAYHRASRQAVAA